MSNAAVNGLLVRIARKLELSPGIVHVCLLTLVTIGYGLKDESPFSSFTDIAFLMIWTAGCVAVVLITWLTKGEYRKIWWRAEPWRKT